MSIEEIRRKAEAGSCVNQCILGLRYLYGDEVEVDYKQAFHFLSAAANQGASRAILNLAFMYAQGLGIPQDVSEAIRLLEAVGKPSDSSDSFLARIELGRIYARGLGIPVDGEKALQWYSEATNLRAESDDSPELQEARNYIERKRAEREERS